MVRSVDTFFINGESFINYCSDSDFNYTIYIGQKCKVLRNGKCFIGTLYEVDSNKNTFSIKQNNGEIDDGYSPEAALLDIKRKNLTFSVTITKQTLYKYIYDGIFMRVTADNLAIKRKRKSYHKIYRKAKRAAAGTSIEQRPADIDTREEFGHWEMDSVMGQQGKSKNALVVLTERKTRYEKIFKVKDHTAASVVKCINSLHRKWGRLFSDIFKTITVDNGTEFADCEGIEKKDKKGKKRTEVYYCHPYCSAERGSNENQNRMIRRHIPKGTNFDRKTKKDIQKVEDWLNNYPRPMFDGRSSQELYEEEMRLII